MSVHPTPLNSMCSIVAVLSRAALSAPLRRPALPAGDRQEKNVPVFTARLKSRRENRHHSVARQYRSPAARRGSSLRDLLHRLFAKDGYTPQQAPLAGGKITAGMQRATVVPHDDVAG